MIPSSLDPEFDKYVFFARHLNHVSLSVRRICVNVSNDSISCEQVALVCKRVVRAITPSVLLPALCVVVTPAMIDGGHANGGHIDAGDGGQPSAGSHRGGSINGNRRGPKRPQYTAEMASLPNPGWFAAPGVPPRRGESLFFADYFI